MYNYFLLIGRVATDVEVRELEDGRKVMSLIIACQRPFKNQDGYYDSDLFKVTLWEFIAELVKDNFKKGSTIGVKGRLATKKIEKDDKVTYQTELIGERIVFFSNAETKRLED